MKPVTYYPSRFLKWRAKYGMKGALSWTIGRFSWQHRTTSFYAYPRHAQVEITTRCNLSCTMCSRPLYLRGKAGNEGKEWIVRDMTFEEFRACLDHLPYLESVLVQGIGEPLLNPDFFRIIDLCGKRKLDTIRTNTNGLLLTEDNIKRILDSPMQYLGVSLDAATPETFEKIRGVQAFDRIINGLRRFVELRDKAGQSHPQLELLYVMMTLNIAEVKDFLRLMADIGGTSVIQLIPVTIPDPEVEHLFLEPEDLDRVEEFREFGESLGLNIDVHPAQRDEVEPTNGTNCAVPWLCVYITAEGLLTPCRFIPLASVINFGNIFEKHYSEIRNTKKYREFRHRLANCPDDVPTPCLNCPKLC